MQTARQMGSGLLYALVSFVLVVGGLSLALAEGDNKPLSPTITLSPTALPQTLTPTSSTPTPLTQAVITLTPLIISSPTSTISSLVNCTPPFGWVLVTVQPGESLSSLASRYQITPEVLEQANCLSTQSLPPGYGIFIPPQSTYTTIPCGPFPGWIRGYVVQPGDTLFHIATVFRTTVSAMERANCKSNSNIIFAGDRLWVPNVPTITPGVTFIPIFDTPTEIPTEPLTLTPLPFTASPFPTYTTEPGLPVSP